MSNQLRRRTSEPSTGKGATVSEEKQKLEKKLREYANDEGHFSLVR